MVLSLPRWARWLLARDAPLASRALAIALRAIFAHYRAWNERDAAAR